MNKPTKFITGILAMALVFGMMAVGCDTGGGGGSSVGSSRTFKNADGNVELTITERPLANTQTAYSINAPTSGEVFNYKLKVAGTQISSGTVTAGASVWSFVSDTDKRFTLSVSGSGTSLTFTSTTTIPADTGGSSVTIPPLSPPAASVPVDPPKDNPSGGDSFTVTNEQVYQLSDDGVVGGTYNGSGTVKIGRLTVGSVTNGRLSFELASTVQSQYLDSIPGDWQNVCKVSPSNARGIMAGDIGLYNGNTQIGEIPLGKIDGSGQHIIGQHIIVYWYFDQAVEITGVSDGMTVSINAHAGWNKVYVYIGQSYSGTMTTNLNNVPSGLQWVFESNH
jgi:hypothetical protein